MAEGMTPTSVLFPLSVLILGLSLGAAMKVLEWIWDILER